jgi:hypothetical protein
MKFTLIVILALVICSSQALRTRRLSNVQVARIEEIKRSNSWAGILLNLAELHMAAKGPIEELVAAIADTIKDL